MKQREAIASATAETINQAEQGVREALGEAGELRQAAMDEATSIFKQIRGFAANLGRALRSAEELAEIAGDAARDSVRSTRDLARTSTEVARSTAEDAGSIGADALRSAAALGESAKDALDEVTASVERARQLVGDAVGGSAAERLRGPRTSRRMRIGLLIGGLAGGAAATYFLDADRGASRREEAIHQLRRWGHMASEAIAATAGGARARIQALTPANATTAYLETTTWEISSGAATSPEDAAAEGDSAVPVEETH